MSRGHWEGNTLVVEVTTFTDNFQNNWVIASQGNDGQIDADTIHYEARIIDERVFTQPVTLAWCAFSRAPKDYVPLEYACFEGNAKNIRLMTHTDVTGIRVDVP